MNKRVCSFYASLRLKGHALHQRFNQWWQPLAMREKRLAGGCTVFLTGLLLWSLSVQPALRSIDHWQTELPRLRSQTSALQALLKDVQVTQVASADSLRQSLEDSALAGHYRLQPPDGPAGHWQLEFTDASAVQAMNWLQDAGRRFSLVVSEAHLHRTTVGSDADASLSGTVRMDQAPGAKEAS